MLEDLGNVVETAVVILRRGWLAALGGLTPFLGLAFLLGLCGDPLLALLAIASLIASYGAALAAFTLALDGRPRVRDVLARVLRRETFHILWALPALVFFAVAAVVCCGGALDKSMPFAAWLLVAVPILGMFFMVAGLLGGVLLLMVGSYANLGAECGRTIDALVEPHAIVLPLMTVLPSVFVAGAVVGGWWNPIVAQSAPGLLTLVTALGLLAALLLLAVLPPALFGVLRAKRATP